ncbi:MAG: TetR family transcriptional regulator [candidate division Zixibacteria bacterium]|nr:TetR family transcriptional regulator [candidate division Zixibacteria bacterium]
MTPRKIDKSKKKQTILLAAIKVFSEKGVKNAKIADIAYEAGIGKGTIYEYFRSRDEIFIETFNYMLREMNKEFINELQKTRPPVDKIKAMNKIIFSGLTKFTVETASIFIDFWAEGIRNQGYSGKGIINLKELYNEFRQELMQVLEDGIKAGQFRKINTLETASAFLASIDGLLLQWIIDPAVFNLKNVSETNLDIFLKGIVK